MATFTGTVSSALLGATPLGQTVTISDADMQDLVTFLVQKYTPRRGPQGGGAAPTPQQALSAWLQEWANQTLGQLHSWKLQQAQAVVTVPAPQATFAPTP